MSGPDVVAHAMRIARSHVEHAASQADRTPTEAQARAGNYSKGHLTWHGLGITIENAKGSKRSGVAEDGRRWSVTMPCSYGYFKQTEGADGDHVDCYIGPHPIAAHVWVIDQVDAKTKRFDEHKCMLGFDSKDKALATYKRAFSDGRGGARIGAVTEMTVPDFVRWVRSGRTNRPLA